MPRRYSSFSIPAILALGLTASAHDPITTKLTWNREISRIVYTRCIACHRSGGKAFSLVNYSEARPWAKAIAEEVLERRMPPWGAVKGFGDFRNDEALTQEQLDLIAQWVEGGAPEGEPKDLPPKPKPPAAAAAPRGRQIVLQGDFTVDRPLMLDGLWPKTVSLTSVFITAEFPSGAVEPLVWLNDYRAKFSHPFLLRAPLLLPKGTVIRGVPPGSQIALLTATPGAAPAHRNGPY